MSLLRPLSTLTLILGLALAGCGPEPDPDPDHPSQECSGHGHLHGEHCHCEAGFVAEGDTCVEEEVPTGACGGHGELHGDHCDCDPGFVAEGDTCVEEEVPTGACGGHGELHGDHCDCDPGYVAEGDTCVPAETCGGHGELHGDHCDCDPGYVPEGLTCVEALACNPADALEPNNSLARATPWVATHAELALDLCTGDTDVFLVDLAAGERITAIAQTRSSTLDLSLALYEPDRDPSFDPPVGRTNTAGNTEQLSHTARKTGAYVLVVGGASNATATYQLSIEVQLP